MKLRWDAVPWKPATRQKQGLQTEVTMLRSIGARQHPASGAKKIKHDGSDEANLYEVKDAVNVFTVRGKDLASFVRRADQQGKNAHLLVFFRRHNLTVDMVVTHGIPATGDIQGTLW